MPLVTYTSICTSKTLIAREVYELHFTKPDGFAFQPGQFVLFDVPLMEKADDVQTRALSIASTPDESELLFVVKLRKGGRLSRWIEETVHEGSNATFKGPFGNFVLDRTSSGINSGIISAGNPPNEFGGYQTGGYLFIATGAGIAPFRPMVMAAASDHPACRLDLLFGVRSEEDLFWKDWLEEISKKHPNVFPHIALSQPSASWTGHRGRVQSVAPQIIKERGSSLDHRSGSRVGGMSLYVCGNPDMTTDVKRLALEEWGVDKKDLHVEGYI